MRDTISPASNPPSDLAPSTRRDFIGQVATAAATIAVTACAAPVVAQSAGAAAPKRAPIPTPEWDDSWAARVSAAKHKAVFDAPDIADGTVLANAFVFMMTYHQMYKTADADTVAVLVMRHQGVGLALGDALWDRYDLGKELKIKDPVTGKWAKRNPWQRYDARDKESFPGFSLEDLAKRGAVLLACNLAANNQAARIAKRTNQDRDAVVAEVRANLVPGTILMPSGVLATIRAQEAGAAFVRST